MIGMMIVGTIWHGGAEGAYAFLNSYDHAAFTEQLRATGLTNTYRTFNWPSIIATRMHRMLSEFNGTSATTATKAADSTRPWRSTGSSPPAPTAPRSAQG